MECRETMYVTHYTVHITTHSMFCFELILQSHSNKTRELNIKLFPKYNKQTLLNIYSLRTQ